MNSLSNLRFLSSFTVFSEGGTVIINKWDSLVREAIHNPVPRNEWGKSASEREKVLIGRISTIALMILAALFSFYLQSAKDVFNLLLQIGAGTGLLFILRWFWHRINPYSEIAAMVISFVIAVFFFINGKMDNPIISGLKPYEQLVIGVIITTLGWIAVTLLTKPTKKETIEQFNTLIFEGESKFKGFGLKIVAFILGIFGVYATLFSIGSFIYSEWLTGLLLLFAATVCCVIIFRILKRTD